MPEKVIVYPGDHVAIAEEFLPGPGTYEEAGEVYAATLGTLELDSADFVARVHRFPPELATLEEGDIVVGHVRGMRESIAIVDVFTATKFPDRAVAGDRNGTLAVRNVADYFVASLEDMFRLGDIVRAEVIQVKPSLQLNTKGARLGVLKSRCPRCREVMDRQGDAMQCPECDWKAPGKLAADYGEGNFVYDGPEPEPERPPTGASEQRRDDRWGGDRDRRGGDRDRRGPRRGGDRDRRGGDRDRRGPRHGGDRERRGPRREGGERRGPRRDSGDRPPRRDSSDGPRRRESSDGPPRHDRAPRADHDRAPRREGAERPPREGGDGPPREAGDGPKRRRRGRRGGRRRSGGGDKGE